MKTYRPWNPRTRYLLPLSMTDWLPDDHLVYSSRRIAKEDVGGRGVSAPDRRFPAPLHEHQRVSPRLPGALVPLDGSKVEDELYGEGREAFEWPEEMKTRERRLKRLKEAR